MPRRILLEWPSEKVTVHATLLDYKESELCQPQWSNLEKPLKMFCGNTVSNGEEFSAAARMPRHPA